MADLKLVSQAIFYKKGWDKISDEEKESCFFILNRMFSKKYPEKAQLLNLKTIDKVVAMDMWYYFMLDKPYPKWFWSKSNATEKSKISNKDFELLLRRLSLKESDLEYLIDNHFDFTKEYLLYIRNLDK
jgi:hypothetical protein